MNRDTLMPDGRPLWAWENELTMLRNESIRVKEKEKDIAILTTTLGLIWERRQDFTNLDWIVRIKCSDAVTMFDFESALAKYLHIEEVKK